MHIPINLSSDPFRRDRPLLVASVACAIALVVLLGAQVYLILAERASAAESRAAVAELRADLASVTAQQSRLDATLLEPANAEVLQRSLLLNALIERKGISWTQLLADLEGIMPNRASLNQIRLPQVNTRNEITLDMEVGAESPTQAIELIRRLESSPLFGPAELLREDPPTDRDPLYRYRLSVSYAQQL